MVLSLSEQINMDTAPPAGAAAEPQATVENELYNFGHAPFEVIQRFQDFCMEYRSLSEALLGIMSREPLLTRKYHFVTAPVMYQMLAKPTADDSDACLQLALDLLKKFTRRGRYDSVANAIEELLLSPVIHESQKCDKETWTRGNLGTNFTELSENEQNVLEKIADSLIYRISSVLPETKKRKSVVKPKKDLKDSPKHAKKRSGENIKKPSPTNSVKKELKLNESETSHTLRFSNSHLCPVSGHIKPNVVRDPVDAHVAVPMKNIVTDRPKLVKQKYVFDKDISSLKKEEFLEGFLKLLPSQDDHT